MKIGDAIKEIRIQKGFSQKALAEEIGISATSLSLIESGTKRPSPSTLKRICKVLKISEPLIYILATDENDIPKEKRELFKMLFPSAKGLLLQIIGA